jgi:hypothetical protein
MRVSAGPARSWDCIERGRGSIRIHGVWPILKCGTSGGGNSKTTKEGNEA